MLKRIHNTIPKYYIYIKDQKETDKEIGKEPDLTNLEDLQFTHLFNKKKFEKLLERRKQDHKINLIEDILKRLNTKAYIITVKENKVLN